MEALYSVLAGIKAEQGGLKASGDRESGQRYNEAGGSEMKGVYFHSEIHKDKAISYATFAPAFGDGTFIQVILECECDLN